MKISNPRGKTPSLIGSSNGRPERLVVERKSECCRCHCDIAAGLVCFGIPKISSSFKSLKRHCKICFIKILEQTQKDLDAVKNLLIEK